MSLLTAELIRIRDELGYNVLTVGAEPYISYHAVFDQVVAFYLQSGATTTSSTAVTAADAATPVTIVLASSAGFAAGARVVVDIDDRQEVATAQSLSGSNLVVLLSKTHSGIYPVTVEGGESIVREKLARLRAVKDGLASGTMLSSIVGGGLKRVDEVEWYPSGAAAGGNGSVLTNGQDLLNFWRDELASSLGVQNLWRVRQSGGQLTVNY